MLLNDLIVSLNHIIWGWPLLLYILIIAIAATLFFNFIQFREFFNAWGLMLFPDSSVEKGDMTPFQAFLNALSSAVGNGSIAGIATAIYAGGPGAAFWVFAFGLLSMALRFAEVFLSNYFPAITGAHSTIGGPMIYLQKAPGGKFLSFAFAFFLLFLGFTSGSAMQANSIRLGFTRTFGISPLVTAFILLAFIAYVVAGGAKRIVKVSDAIVPVKVGLFFVTALIILFYHWQSLLPAFKLIFAGALYPHAIAGGATGFMIQHAMRYGIARSVNATEAGLGTAGVLFGGTGSNQPIKNGIMSMLSVFISMNIVFMIALIIIASGVWNNGETSLDLTISAYETVFGSFGRCVVTFLALTFGVGVMVSYSYIARSCWLFLTSGNFETIFKILFCSVVFLGAIADVDVVWNATDLVNGGLLIINLFGIAWFLPLIRQKLQESKQ
jgi:AGCS family alanine or glycine:cation symporter